jgi:hypothetical protein
VTPFDILRRVRGRAGAIVLLGAALYGFLLPGLTVVGDLLDERLRTADIPACAWRWHRTLAPRFERWARERVRESLGARVAPLDVAGTEWPMFGATFFLGATESLQDAYARDPSTSREAPAVYAASAIDAAAKLLVDPANATWVRAKWGRDYLHRENVFYRMLLIMGLASHARLTGDPTHLAVLHDQVDTLAAEIDATPSGMLDDYPGESYPTDVLWAVAAIRRADRVLGGDHSAFVERFLEKCRAPRLLGRLGLLPYQADARDGRALDDSRGCSNSGILVQAPWLSVGQSRAWYERYAEHFWQERALAAGFTEFPREDRVDHYGDVDSGPVVLGYGFAASAFGLAAARANGRLDHAGPLAGLAVAAAWPLPDGTLALPRFLSSGVDAPYLGEAGLLYVFTRTPAPGATPTPSGPFPWLVYLIAATYFAAGAGIVAPALGELRDRSRYATPAREIVAFAVWVALLLAAILVTRHALVALILLLAAHAIPRRIAGHARI